MREIEANLENIKKFIKNLRKEDLEELRYFLNKKIIKGFIKELKNLNDYYFLADKNNAPIALGGAEVEKNNQKIAKVWLLCAKKSEKNKKELFKFIKEKVLNYQEKYDILYNFIFKSNFRAQKWLEKLGFKFVDTINPDFKLFYYSNGEKEIDIRNIARQ